MERRKDVKKYAAEVNEKVGRQVAFALFSHDPVTCPDKCTESHKEYTDSTTQYQMLFTTHEMLSRKGIVGYRAWKEGEKEYERVLCVIDEKPGAWWGKGTLTEQDLVTLRSQLNHLGEGGYKQIHTALREARTLLQTTKHGKAVRLQTTFSKNQMYAISYQLEAPEQEQDKLRTTLENLYALSEIGGVVVKEPDEEDEEGGFSEIIISRQRLLPEMPTRILDQPGSMILEYATDISLLSLSPWEGRPVQDLLTLPDRRAVSLITLGLHHHQDDTDHQEGNLGETGRADTALT